MQVLDDAFGPLETLFGEVTTTVQSHDSCEVLQLLTLITALLLNNASIGYLAHTNKFTKKLMKIYNRIFYY